MTQHGSSNDDLTTIPDLSIDQFHTYAFEWTSASLAWYLDSIEIKRVTNFINRCKFLADMRR